MEDENTSGETPFYDGWSAYESGEGIDASPFSQDTDRDVYWRAGWAEAMEEHMRMIANQQYFEIWQLMEEQQDT